MRILILNPNTTEAVTSLMLDAGRAVASPGVEVEAITAPRGFPYIASRAEAQIGGAIALEMLAETEGPFDAAILAAFGDPGLLGARELFDFPVIGVSEAAMLTACMLGGQFLIVTFASALCGWYRDCVAMHRLESRCAGVVALDRSFGSLEDARETNWPALVDLANQAIAERDADVAILAGAPLAGLANARARSHPRARRRSGRGRGEAGRGARRACGRPKPLWAVSGVQRPRPSTGLSPQLDCAIGRPRRDERRIDGAAIGPCDHSWRKATRSDAISAVRHPTSRLRA